MNIDPNFNPKFMTIPDWVETQLVSAPEYLFNNRGEESFDCALGYQYTP